MDFPPVPLNCQHPFKKAGYDGRNLLVTGKITSLEHEFRNNAMEGTSSVTLHWGLVSSP